MSIGSVLASTAVLSFVSLYPFYLKKYKNHKYRGLWETLGELNQTARRASIYSVVWLVGNMVYLYLVNN